MEYHAFFSFGPNFSECPVLYAVLSVKFAFLKSSFQISGIDIYKFLNFNIIIDNIITEIK